MNVDVAIAGGGLAGLATAIHLRRQGKRVVCIEPQSWPRHNVGESLDFSAAGLLEELGISVADLLATNGGYEKTAVKVITPRARVQSIWPPGWFAGPPIWCSMQAAHADRLVLDTSAAGIARREGVEILNDRVTDVQIESSEIRAFRTSRGSTVRARWFVDATGRSVRLLGRAFNLDWRSLGPTKLGFWSRFRANPKDATTSIYIAQPNSNYVEWMWEIPLSPEEVSIGCVLPSADLKSAGKAGLDRRRIFEERLKIFDRLKTMLAAEPNYHLHTVAFTPGCYQRPIGANWIMVGDAAAIADPLTSNGVTAALRHGKLAAAIIKERLDTGAPLRGEGWIYRQSTCGMVTALDKGIETLVYGAAIRKWLGLRWAVALYALLGVTTNSIYSKLEPKNISRTVVFSGLLVSGRAWTRVWMGIGKGVQAVKSIRILSADGA